MEFIVINGGNKQQRSEVAGQLRAHGYHFYSPELYFMDDFGDIHFDSSQQTQADQWCIKHATMEIALHHDVVCSDIMLNPELLAQAKEEGFEVAQINLENYPDEQSNTQIQKLIAQHEKEHPSFMKKLTEHWLW